MQGPNGFWCRYCAAYQSCRNAAETKKAKAHHAAHAAAGDEFAPRSASGLFPIKKG